MGLFDFLKSKKKRSGAVSGNGTDGLAALDDADLSGIDPPETRFTQEYREFLESMEDAGRSGSPSGEAGACAEAAPEERVPEEPQPKGEDADEA